MKGQKEKFEIYEQAIVEEQEQTVVATLTNDTVLRRTIPWDTMKSAKLISEGELAMIRKFDKRPAQEREDLLDKEGHEYAELFLNLLSNLTASDGVQYILAIIDELLHDERRIGLFLDLAEHNEALPFGPLLRLLNRNQDLFVYEKASKTVAVLLTKTRVYNDRDVQFFCRWITERLRGDVADVLVAVSALQILLRRREYRPIFHAEEGVKLLGAVLNDYTNKRQVLYQTLFCLWLLSYDEVPAPTQTFLFFFTYHTKAKKKKTTTKKKALTIYTWDTSMTKYNLMAPTAMRTLFHVMVWRVPSRR